ncbi:hypothetical protein [Solitalea canadensis]|nr:hypothetical protein [Solitalea canadensis]
MFYGVGCSLRTDFEKLKAQYRTILSFSITSTIIYSNYWYAPMGYL